MNSNNSQPRYGSGVAAFGDLLAVSLLVGVLAMCFGQSGHAALLLAVGFLVAVMSIAFVWLIFWPISFVEAWYSLGDRSVFLGELILAAIKSIFLTFIVTLAVLIDGLKKN